VTVARTATLELCKTDTGNGDEGEGESSSPPNGVGLERGTGTCSSLRLIHSAGERSGEFR
jgi:hypothetical protein